MKKIICTFAIVIMTMYPLMGNAIYVNVPVYMALTGNDIEIECFMTDFRIVDSQGNDYILTLNGSVNNANYPLHNTTYSTGTHAVLIGFISINTEETYHLQFSSQYFKFTTKGWSYDDTLGEMVYGAPGVAGTAGFGVYFTTWEWPYNDYTIGEFTFWDSNDFNSSGVYLSTVANPASQYFGCFCPDTDATGNLSTLKLFIDFGLGSPYYQNVYYAAGDNGF
mgnify:CR=1 FL=1